MSKIKNLLKKVPKHFYILFLVCLFLFIPAIINHGVHGDDATFHIVNILAMNENSSFFELPTRIRPLTANNFGYGSGIFYPQLIHLVVLYIWKVLQIIHLPLSVAIVAFLFIFTFLIAIVMHKFLHKLTKNHLVSTIGSIFYITYPYFIADIYRRSAYGELISFLSLPIILLGIYYLIYENKKLYFYLCFVLGFHILFASHLISTVYIALFVGIFLLCQGKKIFKKDVIVPLIIASCFALGISLNYIVPIFEHKFLAEYMVFQEGYMYSRETVTNNILPILNLLLPSEWLTSYIPVFIIFLIGLVLFKYKKIKDLVNSKILLGLFLILVVSLLMTVLSCFWKIAPSLLIMIQFPWRNCAYFSFSACVLATFGLLLIPKKYFKLATIIMLILVVLNSVYIFASSTYTPRENTTFSYRDGGMGWSKEYLPKKTYDNLDYFLERDSEIKLVEKNNDEVDIEILNNNTPNLKFSVKTSDKIILEIPRLYYLWYKIEFKDSDGNYSVISYYENENGFIEFVVPSSGVVNVVYSKTLLSNISYVASVLSFIFFLGFIVSYKKN